MSTPGAICLHSCTSSANPFHLHAQVPTAVFQTQCPLWKSNPTLSLGRSSLRATLRLDRTDAALSSRQSDLCFGGRGSSQYAGNSRCETEVASYLEESRAHSPSSLQQGPPALSLYPSEICILYKLFHNLNASTSEL